MTALGGAARAAAPIRVVAIGDRKHMYDGKGPLPDIRMPVVIDGASGQIAFNGDGGMSPLMELNGKIVVVDPDFPSGDLHSRFGDHVVHRSFVDNKDILRVRDGKTGARSTLLTTGDVIDGQMVSGFGANFGWGGSLIALKANARGDVIVRDTVSRIVAIPYGAPKRMLASDGFGSPINFLDAKGRFVSVIEDLVYSGTMGTDGTRQTWWETPLPNQNPNNPSPAKPLLAGMSRDGNVVAYGPYQDVDDNALEAAFAGNVGAPGKLYDRKFRQTFSAGGSGQLYPIDTATQVASVCSIRGNDFAFDEEVGEARGFFELAIVENGTPRTLAGKDTVIDGWKIVTDKAPTVSFASNDVGQLAFVRYVTDGFAKLPALFLYTPGKGIQTVLRAGEVIKLEANHDVKVTQIAMTRGCSAGEPLVLDDKGRMAFRIEYEELATPGKPYFAAAVVGNAMGTVPERTADLELGEVRNITKVESRQTRDERENVRYEVTFEFDVTTKNLGARADMATFDLDVTKSGTHPDGRPHVSEGFFVSVDEAAKVCGDYRATCPLGGFDASKERTFHVKAGLFVPPPTIGTEVQLDLDLNSPSDKALDNNSRTFKVMIPNTGITNGPNGGAGDDGAGCAVTGGHHAASGAPFALGVVGLLWALRRRRR